MLHLKSVVRKQRSVFGLLSAAFHFLTLSLCLLFLPFAISLAPGFSDAFAASVTFGWDASPEPDLEGYVIYRNTGSPGPPYGYSNTLPETDLTDPLQPTATLTGFQEGTEYHIGLTAYNSNGIESDFSNDICVEVQGGALTACSASTSGGGGGGGGGSSGGCFISSAADGSLTMPKSGIIQVPAAHKLWFLFLLFLILPYAYKKIRTQSVFITTLPI